MRNNFTLSAKFFKSFPLLFLMIGFCQVSRAQYFGRNKVNYEVHDFKVLTSPHFQLYNYLDDKQASIQFSLQMEQWYQMHQEIFLDTFKETNPVILYNNHADFQQTNTIGGLIGVGTGGVTEGLKNRVIMPVMSSNAQTDHVLGHELVHAFQYHLVKTTDSLSMSSLGNLPLWMVEGLAEYMSIGFIDSHTAIWLRSAVLNDKLPTLKDLTRRPGEYFPYRWGEAFWAYISAKYGDDIIKPLFMRTASIGYEEAIEEMLDIDAEQFSENWKESLNQFYKPYQAAHSLNASGKKLIGKENAGEMNIVPSLSPDGKLMAFWTEKNLFSIDLYLADAVTGEIGKRITTNAVNTHIDQYSSFESSIAWAPDSRQLAFVSFDKGRNQLLIANIEGEISKKIFIDGLQAFSNPAWSPDGKFIVVSGLVNGQHDLFSYSLADEKLTQLTNNNFSEIQPSWSPDGKWLTYASDRLSYRDRKFPHYFSHQIALLNLQDKTETILPFFAEATNLNPVFSADGNSIFFISDRDGFRNLYQYDLLTKSIFQSTDFYTGITGITRFSPAISFSAGSNNVAYSYYNNDTYSIFSVSSADLLKRPVLENSVNLSAANISVINRTPPVIVQANLLDPPFYKIPPDSFSVRPYTAKLQLDYIGNGGIGISTSRFGTGASGSVAVGFSDMLGNYKLLGNISMNGEIYDLGGQIAYINQKHQFDWGGAISHTPFLSGQQFAVYDSLVINTDTVQVVNLSTDLLRTYQEQAQIFGSYPFSRTSRIEAGGSFARYHYRLDRYTNYYYQGVVIARDREKMETPEGFNIGHAYVALVGDNSDFGIASPLAGHRYRLSVGKYFGEINMQNVLADYRKYFRFTPFTLATRNMYTGRFGKDAGTNVLPPLYLGYPTLIRGYRTLDFRESDKNQLRLFDLSGSQIYVGNVELRLPLSGPERLSVIKSRYFLTQLSLFTDGGIAWGHQRENGTSKVEEIDEATSRFILSSGVSLRVNLFGYIIVEPFYAIPWQNGGFDNATFGLNFAPGW